MLLLATKTSKPLISALKHPSFRTVTPYVTIYFVVVKRHFQQRKIFPVLSLCRRRN